MHARLLLLGLLLLQHAHTLQIVLAALEQMSQHTAAAAFGGATPYSAGRHSTAYDEATVSTDTLPNSPNRLSQALGAVFRSPLGSPFRFPPLKDGGAWQSLPEEGASHFESEHFDPESSSANGFSNGFFDRNGKSSNPAVLSGKTGSKGSSVKGSGSAVAGAAAFSNISARECALVSAYEGFGREPGWSFRSSNRSNSGSSRGSASSSSRNVLMSNTMANASTSSVRASVLMHGRASLSRQGSSTDSLLRASDISLLTLHPERRLTTNSIADSSHHSSSSSSSSSGNSSDAAAGSSAENSTQPPSTQGLSMTGSDTEHEKSDLEHDTQLNLQHSNKGIFTDLSSSLVLSQTAPLPYCSTAFSSTINAMPAPMRSVSRSSSNSTTVATNTHSSNSSSARSPPLQHEAVTVALQAIAVARGSEGSRQRPNSSTTDTVRTAAADSE
eukprot:15090-Heterococcus_DN1.PRE.2